MGLSSRISSAFKRKANKLLDAAENPREQLAYAEEQIGKINQEMIELFENWDRATHIISEKAQDPLVTPVVAAEIEMWRTKKRILLSKIRLELDKHQD